MPAQSVIELFRRAAREQDATIMAELFTDDIKLYGSVNHKPFEGKAAAVMVFGMLLQVCQDIEFVDEYLSENGVALLVRGRIKERQFDGAQFMAFDEAGMITEFRDLIRPLSSVLALQEAAGEYLARSAAT